MLPALATNAGSEAQYEGVKLEVLQEVVPLCKLPAYPSEDGEADTTLRFGDTTLEIAKAINVVYEPHMFDRDADVSNVGIMPDGKVVTLDPAFVFGDVAALKHKILRYGVMLLPTAERAAALYGKGPETPCF